MTGISIRVFNCKRLHHQSILIVNVKKKGDRLILLLPSDHVCVLAVGGDRATLDKMGNPRMSNTAREHYGASLNLNCNQNPIAASQPLGSCPYCGALFLSVKA